MRKYKYLRHRQRLVGPRGHYKDLGLRLVGKHWKHRVRFAEGRLGRADVNLWHESVDNDGAKRQRHEQRRHWVASLIESDSKRNVRERRTDSGHGDCSQLVYFAVNCFRAAYRGRFSPWIVDYPGGKHSGRGEAERGECAQDSSAAVIHGFIRFPKLRWCAAIALAKQLLAFPSYFLASGVVGRA